MDFNPHDYVTPEEGETMFPEGIACIERCRVCNRALLLRPGQLNDCGMHLN